MIEAEGGADGPERVELSDDELKEEVLTLREDGLDMLRIAAKLSIPLAKVKQILE